MTPPSDEQLERAVEQYDRVQSFFTRADARASVLLGLDLGMLGLMIVNAPPLSKMTPWHLIALAALGLLGASIAFVIKQALPKLSGGDGSIIFFGAIAQRTEAKFIQEFEECDNGAYYRDVLQQTHVNARIISQKFRDIGIGFWLLMVAVPFWLITLVSFVLTNRATDLLMKK